LHYRSEAPPLSERERAWADAALARWADFPATIAARPFVFVGPTVLVVSGFHTSAASLAYREGRVVSRDDIPDSVVTAIRAQGDDEIGSFGMREDLELTGAQRLATTFPTDRGPMKLPAWWVTGPQLRWGLYVLDEEVFRHSWVPAIVEPTLGRQPPQLHIDGSVGSDDSTLAVRFTGRPRTLADYEGLVFESDGAVLVMPRARRRSAPPHLAGAAGVRREIKVTLASPLGGRVLVDLGGDACVVEPTPPGAPIA
jgi:hypothetical protein